MGRWLRFLVGGAINTLVTFAIYYLLLRFVVYHVAYFIAFVIGIVLSYFYNTYVVYRVAASWGDLFSFPMVYVVQYLCSASLLWILVEFCNVPRQIVPLLVVLLVLPVTYILMRRVFSSRR